MEIFKAHRQWAQRQKDEVFYDLRSLYDATLAYANVSQTSVVPWNKLRVEAQKDDVILVGEKSKAQISHFGFTQMCGKIEAPPWYLRELPATLAAQNMNHGLKKRADEFKGSDAQLLFHKTNGNLLMRAITTEKYSRIWNHEVVKEMLPWEQHGWKPAMPDIRKTGSDHPACYASDHDMFVFLKNSDVRIKEPGNPDGLQKGIIVGNSEVGTSSIWVMWFLYRAMCGNHIIWGASQVKELRFKHVGNVRDRMQSAGFQAKLKEYAESSVSDEEARIKVLKTKRIAKTKEEVLETLFKNKDIAVSQKVLEASYDAVVPDKDGDPKTPWGMAQGMTRYSQTIPYADQRIKIDQAAGEVLYMTF